MQRTKRKSLERFLAWLYGINFGSLLEPVPKPVRMRGLVQHMAVHKRSHAEWVYFNDIEKCRKPKAYSNAFRHKSTIYHFLSIVGGKNTTIRPHSPKRAPQAWWRAAAARS